MTNVLNRYRMGDFLRAPVAKPHAPPGELGPVGQRMLRHPVWLIAWGQWRRVRGE